MKLFIVLVCLLVVATQAMSHPHPGNATEHEHEHMNGPDHGYEPPPPPKNYTALERLEIRTAFFKVAHDFIAKCSEKAHEAREAHEAHGAHEAREACWIVYYQVRECANITEEEPRKSGCDIFNAVKAADYTGAEQAYGRFAAFLDAEIPEDATMIKNQIHQGMEMIIKHASDKEMEKGENELEGAEEKAGE